VTSERSTAVFGVAAEFDDPGRLVQAARAARDMGYRRLEAYTPYQIRELDGIIEGNRWLPTIVLAGGILGFFTAWGMEFYIAVIDYPINVGGRPLNSWPSFIVIMFELTILFASIFAFFGALGLCGLPLPHHPMFNVASFAEASDGRFFLCIETDDSDLNPDAITSLLKESEPLRVWQVDED
jgi:hypothetical protein